MTRHTKSDRAMVKAGRIARRSLLYRIATIIAATHRCDTAPMIRQYIPQARIILAEMQNLDEGSWDRANTRAWHLNRETVDHTPEEVWPLMLDEIAKGIEI